MRIFGEPDKGRKVQKDFAIPINLQGRAEGNRSTVFGMERKVRVLVANDQRAYREVIGDGSSERTTLLLEGVALDDLLGVVDETEQLLLRLPA